MNLIRALGLLFVFLVMPPLGYLTAATVFTHYGDQAEPGDTGNAYLVAVARSCARQDPITLSGGFKAWYICQADVSANKGPSRTMTARGFLNPDLIGVPVEVGTTSQGKKLVPKHPRHRLATPFLLVGTIIGWVLLMVGILYLLSHKHMRKPLSSPEEDTAQLLTEPTPEEKSYVSGRKKWFKGSWTFGLLLLSVLGSIVYSADAFEGDTTRTVLAVASWSMPVLLFMNTLRRLAVWPAVTISRVGMEWNGENRVWAEIERIELSDEHVLTAHLAGRPSARIGRFGPEQAEEIRRAIRKYRVTSTK